MRDGVVGRLRSVHAWTWAVILVLVALSLLQQRALVAAIADHVPHDLGDPLLNVWIFWWNAQHLPLTADYWNAPAFAPAPNALALSETLLGLTWLTTPAQWLGASPVTAHNLIYVVTPVLNGLSMYWLCLTLFGRRDAAFVGAIAVAFAPYHASQVSHVQTRALFWMPVALVGLHKYWQTGRWRWLACLTAGVVLNGLTCGYFLLYFSVLLGIAIVWLTIATRDLGKAAHVGGAMAVALASLWPIIGTFRDVQREWQLRRRVEEIESLSVDVSNFIAGSDALAIWPIHTNAPFLQGGLYPQYPGIVLMILVLLGGAVIHRRRHADSSDLVLPSWMRWLRRVAVIVAGLAFAAGMTAWLAGPWAIGSVLTVSNAYKPIGLALNLVLLAALSSPRFIGLIRTGSVAGLYATAAVAAAICSLGPLARLFGRRFWYKPPYAWLMALPGFESARVPALFSTIWLLCLGVLAAFVIARLLPRPSRQSALVVAAIAAAIVGDGWARIDATPIPQPMPVPVTADLVVELPNRTWTEEAPAMYRGILHGKPVVNGYSAYAPPHYSLLRHDLERFCMDSLDTTRGGRSLDIVIWRSDPDATRLDAVVAERWGVSTREESAEVIVYRLPATAGRRTTRTDRQIELLPDCERVRPK
jgi:hypothetical protein